MAEAKQKEDWEHTSAIMALIANVNRTKETQAYKPSDFNPFAVQPQKPVLNDLSILESIGFKKKE